MAEHLRDRIMRKLEPLSDDRLYQVLDYVEFLESKYAERQNPASNIFSRVADSLEDRMRAGRMSTAAIAETVGLLNRAVGVLNGVAAAGKSVANDIVSVAKAATTEPLVESAAGGARTQPQPPGAQPPKGDTRT